MSCTFCYNHPTLMQGLNLIVCCEGADALLEEGLLCLAEEGGADAHALLGGAHGVEGEDGDAVVHEGAGELKACHAWIADGEVEAVGKGRTHVVVIDEVEAVLQEHLFHEFGAATVFTDVVEEAVGAVAGCLHEG